MLELKFTVETGTLHCCDQHRYRTIVEGFPDVLDLKKVLHGFKKEGFANGVVVDRTIHLSGRQTEVFQDWYRGEVFDDPYPGIDMPRMVEDKNYRDRILFGVIRW